MGRDASVIVIMLGLVGVSPYVAEADPLKPGDALTYTKTTSWTEQIPEASMGRQAAAKAAAKAAVNAAAKPAAVPEITRSMSSTIAIKIDRLNEDGSAHASIALSEEKRIPGVSFLPIELTVMPDGQIVPKVDLVMLQAAGIDQNRSDPVLPPGYRPRTAAEWTNFAAYVADRSLLLFNDVALGAGKKKTFKEGDAWRIVIPDKNNQTVNFLSHGTQQFQGRSVAVLDFTTTRTTQNGVGRVSGTAFYDPENHVLVKLHAVGDADTVMGVRNQTLEFVLQ